MTLASENERVETGHSLTIQLSQEIGAKVLFTLPFNTPITSVWKLWRACIRMNEMYGYRGRRVILGSIAFVRLSNMRLSDEQEEMRVK
jgi:hypothetical protein